MEKEHFLERFHRNERLAGFSDGVFAIVLTLLVLELRVPHLDENPTGLEMWQALGCIKSKLLSFLVSFIFVASAWFSHNQLFKLFNRIDNTMLWYNNFFLLLICFIPFPTSIIGEYPFNPVGIALFGSVWVFVSLLIYIIGTHAYRKGYIHSAVDIKRYQFLRKVAISYTPLSALPIAFAWSMPVVAFTIYVIMMIGGIVAGFWVKLIED